MVAERRHGSGSNGLVEFEHVVGNQRHAGADKAKNLFFGKPRIRILASVMRMPRDPVERSKHRPPCLAVPRLQKSGARRLDRRKRLVRGYSVILRLKRDAITGERLLVNVKVTALAALLRGHPLGDPGLEHIFDY